MACWLFWTWVRRCVLFTWGFLLWSGFLGRHRHMWVNIIDTPCICGSPHISLASFETLHWGRVQKDVPLRVLTILVHQWSSLAVLQLSLVVGEPVVLSHWPLSPFHHFETFAEGQPRLCVRRLCPCPHSHALSLSCLSNPVPSPGSTRCFLVLDVIECLPVGSLSCVVSRAFLDSGIIAESPRRIW